MVSSTSEHDIELERLASIVASSDDAIISKSLDGIVRTWNAGATKIFGYRPDEIIGQPITMLIPPELHGEETEILAKLRRGERIDHFDTVRLAKDGRRIDISLTVSPLRNRHGEIVGASKVARDVTERKRAEDLQKLLVDELNHRVKNTLAIVQSVASQSMAHSNSPSDFMATFTGRLQALSLAHDLLIRERMRGISLRELVEAHLTPDPKTPERIVISGPDVTLRGTLVTHLSLILHELATNARKYGALSRPDGRLRIRWARTEASADRLTLDWQENGVAGLEAPGSSGFGTQLIEKTLKANGGSARMEFGKDGLQARLDIVLETGTDISETPSAEPARQPREEPAPSADLEGLKVLIVEDEAIVAMDLEMKLEQLGCEIAGLASSLEEADEILQRTHPDIALLDANLQGQRVDRLAEALHSRDIPFAFSTGYGREALPEGFQDRELLAKPFGEARFISVVSRLAGHARQTKQRAVTPPA
ncbi:PAS domain S-box protein [Henriciella aquimarina]|uniref:PAS domain S-box protein n=1 Tax=Henriciella aquimarina TaxID=545261 RepID=UPI000A00A81E|nr:PAS domain S-box protein [Henriciella aquimarina]